MAEKVHEEKSPEVNVNKSSLDAVEDQGNSTLESSE